MKKSIAVAAITAALLLTGCTANSAPAPKAVPTRASGSTPTSSPATTHTIEEAAQEVDCAPLITQPPSGKIAGETNEGSCDVSGEIVFLYEFDTTENATAGSSKMEFRGDHWADGNVIIYTESTDAGNILDEHFTRVPA